jgi:hypothetical protein
MEKGMFRMGVALPCVLLSHDSTMATGFLALERMHVSGKDRDTRMGDKDIRFSRLPPPVGPAGTSVISRFVSAHTKGSATVLCRTACPPVSGFCMDAEYTRDRRVWESIWKRTDLHHLQLLQPLLHQLLYLSVILFMLVFVEGISRPPPGIGPEVVVGELTRLPQQRPVQRPHPKRRSLGRRGQGRRGHD